MPRYHLCTLGCSLGLIGRAWLRETSAISDHATTPPRHHAITPWTTRGVRLDPSHRRTAAAAPSPNLVLISREGGRRHAHRTGATRSFEATQHGACACGDTAHAVKCGEMGRLWRRLARAAEAAAGRPVARPLPLGVPRRREPPGAPRGGTGARISGATRKLPGSYQEATRKLDFGRARAPRDLCAAANTSRTGFEWPAVTLPLHCRYIAVTLMQGLAVACNRMERRLQRNPARSRLRPDAIEAATRRVE